MTYQEILKRIKMDDSNIINAYMYGSRVYGNFRPESDYDFIFIVKERDNEQYSDNLINVNFFTLEGHTQRVNEHEISALECVFLDPQFILKETQKIPFKLDISKLRHALSKKSSNSWVKCKKKLTVPQDYDLSIGIKSMFHAFRIIEFGLQIAALGRIENYGISNNLYEVLVTYEEWEKLFENFKPRYNTLMSEFRLVTHK